VLVSLSQLMMKRLFMNNAPLVSVIIPVYNAEKYIDECINSILEQSYKNLEILIINDGSTDGTLSKLESYNDVRIRLITRENQGLAKTLRELVDKSTGIYIARMDADDISHKDRISQQVNKFLSNDKLVLVGTNVDYISGSGKYLGSSICVCSNYALKKKLNKGNVLFHPTVMFNREMYFKVGGYNKHYEKYIEDYLLWIKMKDEGEIAVLPSSLLCYRVHESAISSEEPVGLDLVIKKISDNNGDYKNLNTDYEDLVSGEKIIILGCRKTGYKTPYAARIIIIVLLEFYVRVFKRN
jgi:glycosyltransferase involved in cell wall biosynthesis